METLLVLQGKQGAVSLLLGDSIVWKRLFDRVQIHFLTVSLLLGDSIVWKQNLGARLQYAAERLSLVAGIDRLKTMVFSVKPKTDRYSFGGLCFMCWDFNCQQFLTKRYWKGSKIDENSSSDSIW